MPKFLGVRLSQDSGAARDFDVSHVRLIEREDAILTGEPGVIGDGGNSGFQALNIAVQFGAVRILLVGFDMRLDRGVHWHGRHGNGLNNPAARNLVRWRKALDEAAATLARLGVTVVNCSPVSTLTAYPIVSLEEALCSAG